jgi:hypothetical protein
LVAAVGIVDDELSVVEDVECLGAEFKSAAFGDLEKLVSGVGVALGQMSWITAKLFPP